MLISPATTQALDEIAGRAADLLAAYTPGAVPSHTDISAPSGSKFTLNRLTASAPAEAFFVSTDSSGRQIYSRDGEFHLQSGLLVNRNGDPVLGYRDERSGLVQLRADAIDAALDRTRTLRIESDGALMYDRSAIDPRTGRGSVAPVSLGRLALARFSAATKLQQIDPTRFLCPAGIAPHLGRAGDGNFGAVKPQMQANSRVDLDRGLQRLQEAYLRFDALRAAHSAQGSLEKATMDLLK